MRRILWLYAALTVFLAAFPARGVDINTNLPGSYSPTSPVGIVGNFYQFALMIGGLLAFGAIVWGGIRYATSAGNPGGQSDARDQVTQALLGLLLLVGAFLVLRTISPGLTTVSLPGLEDIKVPGNQSATTTTPAPSRNCCGFRDPNKPACGTIVTPCNNPPSLPGCNLTSVTPIPQTSCQ